MSDILEQDAARDLRKHGINSAWGCSDGVFVSSSDSFRVARLIRLLKEELNPSSGEPIINGEYDGFYEAKKILMDYLGDNKKPIKPDKRNGVSKLDLG